MKKRLAILSILMVFVLAVPVYAGIPLNTAQSAVNRVLEVLRDPKLKSPAAKEIKKEKIGVAFSGQGADELFAGYFKLRKITDQEALDRAIRKETQRALLVDQKRDQAIASSLGINLKTPYLDPDFINFALKIPAEEKIIKNFEGKPIDKSLLRNLGKQIGLPEAIFRRPKKSFQYSTGIQKEIKKGAILPHEVSA